MQEIDLSKLIDVMFERWLQILVSSIAGFLILFIISNFFIAPTYKSKVTVYVDSSKGNTTATASYNDIMASQMLVNTYMQVMASNTVVTEIANEVSELGYTPSQIAGMLTISALSDTELFAISVSNNNPEHAYKIGNAVANIGIKKVQELIPSRDIKVIDPAQMPLVPSAPNVKKNAVFGFILGFIISAGFFILIEFLDIRIKSEQDIESITSIPIIGVIPSIE